MADAKSRPTFRTRFLRISLRTFFVVLTVVCVAGGWWVNRAVRQQRAVRWVQAHGGNVNYWKASWTTNERLQELGLLDYFCSVFMVEVGSVINELQDLRPLADLPHLTELRLRGCRGDLKPLSRLRSLRLLSVEYSEIHDLTPLTSLTEVRDLRLDLKHPVDLAALASMRNSRSFTWKDPEYAISSRWKT